VLRILQKGLRRGNRVDQPANDLPFFFRETQDTRDQSTNAGCSVVTMNEIRQRPMSVSVRTIDEIDMKSLAKTSLVIAKFDKAEANVCSRRERQRKDGIRRKPRFDTGEA
jgi:hypothetical protein